MDGSVCVHGGIEYYLVRCGRDSYIGIHYLSCDDMDQINPCLESDERICGSVCIADPGICVPYEHDPVDRQELLQSWNYGGHCRALEQLGENNLLTSIVPFDNSRKVEETLTDRTIGELVKACFEMGKARTGALIVLEQAVSLQEYERTGISIDSLVSSQLILNIFEKNTPLHDGAVIMSGNRIRSATCYLPLSDNMTLSKALGTRHRAAVGVSEVSDSLTIVVSEETGSVSVARGGRLLRNLNQEQLKKQLQALQPKTDDSRKIRLWKGRGKNESKDI